MQLTPRETEVLALLKTGRKTSECAAELGITLGTWKVYASHVYQKMGVRSRLELLRRREYEPDGEARTCQQLANSFRAFMVPCSESFVDCDYTFS